MSDISVSVPVGHSPFCESLLHTGHYMDFRQSKQMRVVLLCQALF